MSVFNVLSCIDLLADIGVRIYDAVKKVKSFKSQSKTIATRIEVILLPVSALQREVKAKPGVLSDLERAAVGSGAGGAGYDVKEGPMMYIRPLKELQSCMENLEAFLFKLGDTKWFGKFTHMKIIQYNFDAYNEQLTTLQQSLGFCLQVVSLEIVKEMKKRLSDAFDKDIMEKQKKEDLERDLESIQKDLEELKQDGNDQSQDNHDIKESLKLILETMKKEIEGLRKEIKFKGKMESEEMYVSELRMDYSEFTDGEKLQEGTYGPIIKTKHRFAEMLLVIKAFDDKEISAKVELKDQLKLWKNLRFSSFIVQLVGYTTDHQSRMCFVVEYMPHGTLRNVLKDKENHPLPWEQRVTLARDCALGLFTIHFGQGQGKIMLHRAITSTRFLIDGHFRAKISDNGFVKSASKISKSKTTMSSGGRGSVELDEMNYLCPEETSQNFKPSIKSEVYKLGVIFYEIASRMQPFQAMEQQGGTVLDLMEKYNFIEDGKTEDPPSDTPEPFKDLISLCRQRAPDERPSTDAVVAHLNKMCQI